jgi:hypothetical protein
MDIFEEAIHNQVKQDYEEWKKQRLELKPGEKYFQLVNEGVTIKDSINRLVYELTNDPDYFYLWQSNIAGALKIAFDKDGCVDNSNIPFSKIHELANDAAVNFLNNLCNQPKTLGKKKPNE